MFKTRFISILALLCLTVTSAWADADVTWNSSNVSDIQFWGGAPDGWDSYTKEGVTLRGNAEQCDANWANYGYGDGINFNMNASGGYTFTAPDGKKFTKIEMTIYSYDGWYMAAYDNQLGSGWPSGEDAAMTVYSTNKVTWTGDATSTVDLLTDAGLSSFGGATVSSIDFYFEAPAEPVASWVGNSAINANGTWYYAGENFGWCTGGAFNGADLGTITTLSLGGQSQAWAEGNANWNDGNLTMTMGYKIDGGADESLSLNWFEFADNNNKFQSGGSSWAAQDIDISGLTPGNHTIAVWFTRDDKWDSNNSANYVANFTIPTPAPAYAVTIDDAGVDASNWQATPAEQRAGQTVTLSYSGKKKVKSITIEKANVPVESITLNKTATEIAVGQTETLSVTEVLPANATDQTYTWKTSDETKATVDQTGKVTAVAAGTVNIYAEANDGSGVQGTCAVTVKNAATTVTWNFSDLMNLIVRNGMPFTKDGITLSAGQNSRNMAAYSRNSIVFQIQDANGFTFTAPSGKKFTKIEMTFPSGDQYLMKWIDLAWMGLGSGWSSDQEIQTTGKVTWTGNASSVDLLKGCEHGSADVYSFVFTLE